MMIAVIGDLHLQLYKGIGKANHGTSEKFLKLEKALYTLANRELCHFNVVILTGDIYHKRDVIDSKCHEVFNNFIHYIKQLGCQVIAVIGNHDIHTADHYDTWMRNYPGFDNDWSSSFQCKKLNIGLLHYTENPTELKAEIDFLLEKEPDLVVGHLGLQEVAQLEGFDDGHAVSSKLFKKFQCPVVMGHYHNPRSYGNVEYIGTPYATTFGEGGRERAVAVFKYTPKGLKRCEGIPLDMPDMITATVEEYNEKYSKDPEKYPFVKLKDSSSEIVKTKGENIVSIQPVVENDIQIDGVADLEMETLCKTYFKRLLKSQPDLKSHKKLFKRITKEVLSCSK